MRLISTTFSRTELIIENGTYKQGLLLTYTHAYAASIFAHDTFFRAHVILGELAAFDRFSGRQVSLKAMSFVMLSKLITQVSNAIWKIRCTLN